MLRPPFIIGLLALTVVMPPLLANVSIRTSLIPDSIQLGQTAIWRVTISAPSSEPLPKVSPPNVTGLSFQSQHEDTIYLPKGDQLMATITQQFVVTPRTPGVFKLPAIQLIHRGKPIRSNALVLLVTSPPEAKPGLPKSAIELISQVSAHKVYVGQPIHYSLTARLAPGITDEGLLDYHTLTPPLMAGFIELMAPPTTSPAGTSPNRRSKPLITRVLIPMTPGLHTLSEATLVTRFSKQAVTQLSVSEPLDIEVLPIPNPPPTFKGAVGNLSLQVSATTLRGRPDQPIPIWVTLRGEGNPMMINELICPTANGVHIIHRLTEPSPTQWQTTKYRYDITPQQTGTIQIPGFQLLVFSPTTRSFKPITSPGITLLISDHNMPVLPYPPDIAGPIDHMPYDGRPLMIGLSMGSLGLLIVSEWLLRRRRSRTPSSNWPRFYRNTLVKLAKLHTHSPSPDTAYQLYQLGISVLAERLQQPLTQLSHGELIGTVLSAGGHPEWVSLLTEWGDCIHPLVYAPDGVSTERYHHAVTLTRQLIQKTAQWRPVS